LQSTSIFNKCWKCAETKKELKKLSKKNDQNMKQVMHFSVP